MTADLVGDYLFTDPAFIKRLSTENRSVFEKIWDEIKYLCKVVTAGSKEAKQLEAVKRAFEDAYRENGQATGDTKYSISDNKILNKLTGEEIDGNTYRVLDRLNNGEGVTSDEIASLKEVQEGQRKTNELVREFISQNPEFSGISPQDVGTYLLNGEERVQLREQIIAKRSQEGSFSGVDKNGKEEYNGSVKRGKRLDIVIGLPASGKSSSIVNPLSQFYQSVVIDSDIIKTRLPEYNDGWGSMLVHEESSSINSQLLEETMNSGKNVVLPIVGAKIKSVEKYIAIANRLGYEVNVHLNELPNGKAVGRMLKRYFDEGRFINPAFALEYGDKPTEVYEQIKQRGGISGYSRWNNDVPKGQRPVATELSENSRLYGAYSSSWRASRGQVSGRLVGATGQARQIDNEIAPTNEASSTDGAFFDAQKGADVKYSLTSDSDGRQLTNGTNNVYGKDIGLESAMVAPEPEVVSEAEMFPDDLAPIQGEIERLTEQRDDIRGAIFHNSLPIQIKTPSRWSISC